MTSKPLPHFVIKNRFQKSETTYQELLKHSTLSEVCEKVTGQPNYTCEFVDEVNVGRLAVLTHDDHISYISFSEKEIKSRNASFQSLPSALSRCILDSRENTRIYYYFLPEVTGNFETEYFVFMYRLMKTAGVTFLNLSDYVSRSIESFASPDDIILSRNAMRSNNPGNSSSYVTRGENSQVQIYGKTYGASKYETTLICVAISRIAQTIVELYEIEEGGLNSLPKISKEAIATLGVVKIFQSNDQIESISFTQSDSIRSPRYIYNLLQKWGDKKCAFCDCEIPQIIQGAHVWPVYDIKREAGLDHQEKVKFATDGENGLWLCENHHKLFDTDLLALSNSGQVVRSKDMNKADAEYIVEITTKNSLPSDGLSETLLEFLTKRNLQLNFDDYVTFH